MLNDYRCICTALEEGREVYAIPGAVDSLVSQGTNHLIQNGARLVTSAEEILEDLAPQIRASLGTESRTLPRNDGWLNSDDPVLKLLTNEPLSLDEIAIGLDQNPTQISSHLTQLELEGAVRRAFGGRYARI